MDREGQALCGGVLLTVAFDLPGRVHALKVAIAFPLGEHAGDALILSDFSAETCSRDAVDDGTQQRNEGNENGGGLHFDVVEFREFSGIYNCVYFNIG